MTTTQQTELHTRKLTLLLAPSTHERVHALAHDLRMSVNEWIRAAIDAQLVPLLSPTCDLARDISAVLARHTADDKAYKLVCDATENWLTSTVTRDQARGAAGEK